MPIVKATQLKNARLPRTGYRTGLLALETQRETLIDERKELGQMNRLRQHIAGFDDITSTIDELDFAKPTTYAPGRCQARVK